ANGRYLGRRDSSIPVWEVGTHKVVRNYKFSGPGYPTLLAFSGDGSVMATNDERSWSRGEAIRVGEVKSGKILPSLHKPAHEVICFALDEKGTLLVSGARIKNGRQFPYAISLWETATGKERRRFKVPGIGGIASVALSPDSTTVAIGNREDPVILWS